MIALPFVRAAAEAKADKSYCAVSMVASANAAGDVAQSMSFRGAPPTTLPRDATTGEMLVSNSTVARSHSSVSVAAFPAIAQVIAMPSKCAVVFASMSHGQLRRRAGRGLAQ